ncbi:hypothetical protein V1477_020283, partial [Vespula maculifrons]
MRGDTDWTYTMFERKMLQLSLSSSTPFHPSVSPLDLPEENSWETGKLWKS